MKTRIGLISKASEKVDAAREKLRPWKAALIAVIVSTIGCTAVYALFQYRQVIASEEPYCVRPAELRLVRSPRTAEWMTPEIADEIRESLAGLPTELSLMEPSSAKQLAEALGKSPWVEKVEYVRFDSPQSQGRSRGVEVAMTFRRPVAFVEIGRGDAARYVLVDRHGVVLSREAAAKPWLGSRRFVVLDGVRTMPPSQGMVWDDAAVQGGVEVAHVLRRQSTALGLMRIDVSDPSVMTLRTEQTTVVWGGPRNRQTEVLEGTPEAKARALVDFSARPEWRGGLVIKLDLVERCWELRRLSTGAGRLDRRSGSLRG